jgi:hypothetical protein
MSMVEAYKQSMCSDTKQLKTLDSTLIINKEEVHIQMIHLWPSLFTHDILGSFGATISHPSTSIDLLPTYLADET